MSKITIVDDETDIAQDLAHGLEEDGHSVVVTGDTGGIVQQLLADPPDLLILDVMFPDNPVAGLDAARKIRQNKKLRAIPIILLTGINKEFPTNFSSDDIDGTWLPVQDFLEKPVSMPALLGKVKALLSGNAHTRNP